MSRMDDDDSRTVLDSIKFSEVSSGAGGGGEAVKNAEGFSGAEIF